MQKMKILESSSAKKVKKENEEDDNKWMDKVKWGREGGVLVLSNLFNPRRPKQKGARRIGKKGYGV